MHEDFNLVYYHRESKAKYLVKKITRHDCIILDLETMTKFPISKWALDKSYYADKDNEKRRKKVTFSFFKQR